MRRSEDVCVENEEGTPTYLSQVIQNKSVISTAVVFTLFAGSEEV